MTSGAKKVIFTLIGAILLISFSRDNMSIITQKGIDGTLPPFSIEAYYDESIISYYEALNMIIASDKKVYVVDGTETRDFSNVSVRELFDASGDYYVVNADYLCVIDESVTLVRQ